MYYHSDSKWNCKVVVATVAFFVMSAFSVCVFAQSIPAGTKDDPSFPTYGKGKITVRLYTDYFCPPCQASEPEIEPVLEQLVKEGAIRVTFVDTPTTRYSPLYVKYFLYAMKKKNSFANAMRVRQALFVAAKDKITDEDKLQVYLAEKKIAFTAFDVKPTFNQLNDYLKKDSVGRTPSAVIEKNGKIESTSGGADIVSALKELK
jgi:protein-disulfide isomerase